MCDESKRLKDCIYAVVSELVNNRPDSALNLARVGMYGGSVNNPLDCADPKRNYNKRLNSDGAKDCAADLRRYQGVESGNVGLYKLLEWYLFMRF